MDVREQDEQDAGALISEDNLARRIKYEMEQRGWSQERLAREMTQAGYPMHQTSVGKIVNPGSGKRRSISVDDAIGFATVFGIPLERLLIPLEAVLDEELFSVLTQLIEMNKQRMELDMQSMELVTRFVEISQHLGGEPEDVLRAGRWNGTGPLTEELRRWGKSLMASLEKPEFRGKTVREVIELLREEESRYWQRIEENARERAKR